jgi:hypothetical protein
MKLVLYCLGGALVVLVGFSLSPAKGTPGSEDGSNIVSYSRDIIPIIEDKCLRCHTEEKSNPSELYLDSYSSLMEGGKHGKPVLPGKGEQSILVQKLGASVPFGDRMPLKRKSAPTGNYLTEEQVKLIADWIDQGAKNN